MDTEDIKQPSLWIPMSEPINVAHIGKLGEEASELARICCRIMIQGIDAKDPGNHKINRDALTEEIADVYAMAGLCMSRFKLDVDRIADREHTKKVMKRTWFDMLAHALGAK